MRSPGDGRSGRVLRAGILALVALSILACAERKDIEEIKKTQKEILDKLAALEKNDQTLLARVQGGQRPPGPDPDRVYQIALGNSPSKGPKEAPVTLLEFSDFQ
jgi:protein-disulfide isomerase